MQRLGKTLLAPLLVLLVSLTGCATRSPEVPQVLPEVVRPVPPAELMEPEQANYSERVEALFRKWREMLTASPGS